MNNLKELEIKGVYLFDNFSASDDRGLFVKTFHSDFLKNNDLSFELKESYYSISRKNVIRGMHFQNPPHDHDKMIYVSSGKILDVILDLRKNSSSFGKYISIELNEHKNGVFIPKGCAHGFCTLSDIAMVHYNVSSVYNQMSDNGILYNSFGFDWPVLNPIISTRDLSFMKFKIFSNPFK
jgi:dTDP-4-dehydrorhamnose 3,5-epimerase